MLSKTSLCISSKMIVLILLVLLLIVPVTDNWIIGSSEMPVTGTGGGMAACIYNETIFILGGGLWIEYRPMTQSFLGHVDTSSRDAFSAYASLNHRIYIDVNVLGIYYMNTKTWTQTSVDTPGRSEWPCFAATNEYLFIINGYDSSLQILNITDNEFIINPIPPSMTWTRQQASCIVHPITNELYVIGGSYLKTIEKIAINDMENGAWVTNANDLLHSTQASSAVAFGDCIFVIGGYSGSYYIQEVSIIDAINGNVMSGGYLSYAVSETTAIVLGNIIYAFGGVADGGGLNTWQYETLPTMSPTTAAPSAPTTNEPTLIPTTNEPTTNTPTECEENQSLKNVYCTDDGCQDGAFLDSTLSFSVCRKQSFIAKRNGLWDRMADCFCTISLNGEQYDYSQGIENRRMRRLKRGNNDCDVRVVHYEMFKLSEPMSSQCNQTGYRFMFGIEACYVDCTVLTQSLYRINGMSKNEIIGAIKSCSKWAAMQEDKIGFEQVEDVHFDIIMKDDKKKCDIKTGGVKGIYHDAMIVIIVTVILCIVI